MSQITNKTVSEQYTKFFANKIAILQIYYIIN